MKYARKGLGLRFKEALRGQRAVDSPRPDPRAFTSPRKGLQLWGKLGRKSK